MDMFKWFTKEVPDEKSIEKAVRETEDRYEGLIEKKALEKYVFKHWQVNPNNVFSVNPKSGIPYLDREPIDLERAKELKLNSGLITNTLLWDVIQNTLRQKAIEKSVMESRIWEEVLAGKMMIHSLNIINTIVEECGKIDVDKLPKGVGKTL